jgi:hypothetical protein
VGVAMSGLGGIRIRPATPEDDRAIVALLCETLGWVDDDRHRLLFAWKHRSNPFGSSPGWVATDEDGLVGSRTFMRWSFLMADERISAVRAVDTATHPRAQGRGIFRALTMEGVKEMSAAGVDWVFNTPNDRSAPGYLSMGWRRMGRLPVAVRPAGFRVAPRLLAARQAGDLWSLPTSVGEEAATALADDTALVDLLARVPPTVGLRSERTPAYLRWRYGSSPVGYRALLGGTSLGDGVVFFRLRRRGPAVEAVIGDMLVPADRPTVASRLYRTILHSSEADYIVAIGTPRPRWWVPVPGNGPMLTWRGLRRQDDPPPLDQWKLSAGDVELF